MRKAFLMFKKIFYLIFIVLFLEFVFFGYIFLRKDYISNVLFSKNNNCKNNSLNYFFMKFVLFFFIYYIVFDGYS